MTPWQEELVRALGRLRTTHDAAELRLADAIDAGSLDGPDPVDVVDGSGRPFLEGMQVALVAGWAALVEAEART